MRLIFTYMKRYWLPAIAAALLMSAEVVMDLMQPTLMARIVDVGIAQLDMTVILRTGAFMVLLSLAGAVGGIGCTITSAIAAGRMAEDLRKAAFTKVLALPYRAIDRLQTGSIVTRLTNDITLIENTTRMALRIMVRAPLMVIGSLVMALILRPELGLIVLGSAPIIVLAVLLIVNRAYPLYLKVQQCLDRVNTRVFENLAGVRLVRAFVRRDEEQRRFDVENDAFAGTSVRAGRVAALVHPTSQIILYAAIAFIFWIGGRRVATGEMELGKVIAVINYVMQMLWSLIMVSHLIMQVSRAQASITRVSEILDKEPGSEYVGDVTMLSGPVRQDSGASREEAPAVEFRDVSFSYDDAHAEPALSGVTFSVRPGETVAILGETGSGKSTLVQLIPRLYDASAGTVLVNGMDVLKWPTLDLRKRIGMAPQEVVLFSGTFESNISFGREDAETDWVDRAASTAEIGEFIKSLPGAYDTDINQRGLNLSGGQKQRVSIARALAMEPEILILDDATSAVDTATEARILNSLSGNHVFTILVVAQRITTAMRADRIVLLDRGKVSAIGSHVELMESSELYQEIYQSQLGDPEALNV